MAIQLEEAAKCSKCGLPGELISTRPIISEGTKWDLSEYQCDRQSCPWEGWNWLVQSDANGIVYEREIGSRGMDKTFNPISPGSLSRGKANLEDALRREVVSKDVDNRDR